MLHPRRIPRKVPMKKFYEGYYLTTENRLVKTEQGQYGLVAIYIYKDKTRSKPFAVSKYGDILQGEALLTRLSKSKYPEYYL